MELKKNQEILLTIEDFTREGEGLGKYQGFPLFVKDTVIGDKVKVSVTKLKKNYGYARLVDILEPSPDRVTPPCPVARQCGGCKIQQLSYEKTEGVQMEPGGKLPETHRWILMISKEKWSPSTVWSIHGIIGIKPSTPSEWTKTATSSPAFTPDAPTPSCQTPTVSFRRKSTKIFWRLFWSICVRITSALTRRKTHTGLVRHILTRVGFVTGEIMVCLVLNGKKEQLKNSAALVEKLAAIPGMTSIIVNTNKEKTNRILGAACETLWGRGYIEDYIGDVRYQIGPLSFFQVNPAQTKVLYSKALEYADLKGEEIVWDLYCGIGTISLFLAQKASQVCGVEIVREAIDDARRNAALNQMDNVTFFVGKAEEIVPAEYRRTGVRPDVIVVDPPRKGCDETLLHTMTAMAPERIVYVSCDPATLARDCRILCEEGYEITRVAVVDQFGHSCHVETVCLLSNRKSKPDTHVDLTLDMEDYYRIKDQEKQSNK